MKSLVSIYVYVCVCVCVCVYKLPSFSSVQFNLVTQSCPALCNPMNPSTLGLPIHHQLQEFTQTHVHQVGEAIQPCHPLLSPSPPSPNPSQHQSNFQWVIGRSGKNTQKLYKKDLHNQDNYDAVITHLQPHIMECEVKWALESITMNKASGGDGIQVELFQILEDDAVKVLHSICQKIWKTEQWPQD